MKRLAWVLCAVLWACGGGSGGGDPGGTPDVSGDLPGLDVQGDPGMDPGGDPGRDTAAEPGSDPGSETAGDPGACLCDVAGPCCDGCQPLHEGEACGGEAPCTVAGVCRSGSCEGEGPLACPPPDDCHHGEGQCNPASGLCEYAVAEDGRPCAAVPQTPWSGWCFQGACLGFGDCDHRTYGQPYGSACNFPGECASGVCREWGNGWTAFCSLPCGRDLPDCPGGSVCVRYPDGNFCRPATVDATLPGDASGGLFQVCNRDEDCAGNLCLGIDGKRFCADPCDDGAGAAAPEKCGSCGVCRDNGDELGFQHKFYCVPVGVMEFGQPCGFSGECATRFCQDGLCSGQCFSLGEGLSTCPENMDCVAGPIVADPTIQICVPKGTAGKGFFEPCTADWACTGGWKCLPVAGENRCTATCSEEAPCGEGTCVTDDLQGGTYCVPSDQVGGVGQGEACMRGWQCAEGRFCYGGACLAPCPDDGNCGGQATCFLDATFQAQYCTVPCGEDGSCPSGLACFQGLCVLTMQGGGFLHGTCRVDRDCESGACRKGVCTEACSPDLPCEGAQPIAEQPDGLCRPCDPALYDSDCNDGGWGLNTCVTGSDGSHFCATDCMFSQTSCPLGTRCYSLGFQSVCAPIAFNCSDTIACLPDGTCARRLPDGALCREDAACRSGVCDDGICGMPVECSTDPDCGCDLKVCSGGRCRFAEDLVREIEPNDVMPERLSGASGRRLAALYPDGDLPDVDRFQVSLRAGEALDVFTAALCGAEGDTLIRLLRDDGTPIPGWENDDNSNVDWFSSLWAYRAETDQDVVVEVVQSPYVAGYARFPYLLTWRAYAVAANDTCEAAAPLAPGRLDADLASATHDLLAPACAGLPGPGRDLFWEVTVPPGQAIQVQFAAGYDAMIYLLGDCGAPETSCLAGANTPAGGGETTLLWWNQASEPVPVRLAVDTPSMDRIGPFTLDVSLTLPEVPENDRPEGAIDLLPGFQVAGTLLGAANDADPGDQGCAGQALPGADVFYRLQVPAGAFLTVEVPASLGGVPFLWLSRDPGDPATCVAAGQGFLSYLAQEAEVLLLAVDSARASVTPGFSLLAVMGPPGACFGPCDPAAATPACDPGDSRWICSCDATRRVWVRNDCEAQCRRYQAVGGACHAFTTPGYQKDGCLCEWTCDAVTTADQCDQLAYTNCTCAASDPCGWVGDQACDEFCAIEYPGGFEDPVDCARP